MANDLLLITFKSCRFSSAIKVIYAETEIKLTVHKIIEFAYSALKNTSSMETLYLDEIWNVVRCYLTTTMDWNDDNFEFSNVERRNIANFSKRKKRQRLEDLFGDIYDIDVDPMHNAKLFRNYESENQFTMKRRKMEQDFILPC
ncbi:CLUMA_CG013970, isoform A [Clunio marinus]|uniref:CLUMA_CG013970, isoform A n=1 Tax=Clunio marinus TaxID=568069 RepID=A0A1J1IQD2_9DIPT|nr:CLUMA_CG013970, isoform A [Clunio marinus]